MDKCKLMLDKGPPATQLVNIVEMRIAAAPAYNIMDRNLLLQDGMREL